MIARLRVGMAAFALVLCGTLPGLNAQAATTLSTEVAAPDSPDAAVFAHPASPADVLRLTERAATQLRDATVVRGTFIQQRHLADLPRPLESRGDFLFARDAGIVWHTESPFPSRVALSRNGIVQSAEGADDIRIDASRQPAMHFVARVFFALFALDVDELASDFELYAAPRDDGWLLGLRPRAPAVRALFARVVLAGDDHVEHVTLYGADGDRTGIALSDVHHEARALTTEERRQFR